MLSAIPCYLANVAMTAHSNLEWSVMLFGEPRVMAPARTVALVRAPWLHAGLLDAFRTTGEGGSDRKAGSSLVMSAIIFFISITVDVIVATGEVPASRLVVRDNDVDGDEGPRR